MLRRSNDLLAAWPRLTRFYGIGPTELANTPRAVLMMYVEALPRMEATEQLMALQVADHPHVGEIPRQDTFRRWKAIAEGRDPAENDPQPVDVSTESGQAALAGLGIKVVTDSDA